MANEENLQPFEKGQSGNPYGRPNGARNRSTIAREVMAMKIKMPDKVINKLKEIYPDISNNLTIEEAMTYIQATKAIQKEDTTSYKALMDSGYGLAKQSIDNTNSDGSMRLKAIITTLTEEELMAAIKE